MAVDGRRVTVGTSATRLDTADTDSVSGKSITVKPDTTAIDLGDDTVTSGSGFEVAGDATLTVDLASGEELYGIAASGTVTVHVLESGV